MQEVNVAEIQPGQQFDKSLTFDGKSIFIPEGMPCLEDDIRILSYWKIKKLYLSEGEGSEDVQEQTDLHDRVSSANSHDQH